MSKKDYRVHNWKDYNKSLINRVSITFWIDEKNLQSWYENKDGKKSRGRPKKYNDIAIITILLLKQVYRLTLRASQGFTKSLFKLMQFDLDVPSYTRICRRQESVVLPKLPKLAGSIHMVIDSSGLKIFGEGEWKVRQHGWSKHRMWRKLHIGVDENSKLIVTAIMTENNCGDDKKLSELLNQYEGEFHQVSADGAYDSHDCFNDITGRGAIATIPPQPNPKHKAKTEDQIKRARDKVVWEIQQKGRKEWKQQSGYHRRSLAENSFYRYKKILGDKLASRKFANQQIEALLRCHALNRITLNGMPISASI
jgi:IS5 family transposase